MMGRDASAAAMRQEDQRHDMPETLRIPQETDELKWDDQYV